MAAESEIEVSKSVKMIKCSYCTNRASRGQSNHSFPLNDPTLLKEWLKNMKLTDGWTPTVHSRLCSDHFLDDCFKTNPSSLRRTLKKGSIPTIFEETKKKCAYCKVTKSQGQVKRSLHRFPLSGPKTLAKWLGNMAIKDWYPTEESRLCSDHFEPSCLRLERGYITLRDGSIPSIFIPESRVAGDAASISQTPPEASPVSEVTELDQASLEQRANIDQTELSAHLLSDETNVDTEIAVDNSESLATCPQCNHTFDPKGLSGNLKRKSSADENCPKRPRTDAQCESSESTVSNEFEPVAISSRSEFQFPNANEMRKLTLHDHHYEISPLDAKKKLVSLTESNKQLRRALKIEKQRCTRMKKMITSLQES